MTAANPPTERETIHVLTESGTVQAMDLPLHESIQARMDRGVLRRVNEDGSPYEGEPELVKPAASASKAEWVRWAVRHPDESRRMSPDDAEAATKQDLIDAYRD